MNGSGSAGIMASDNGFARHDSASAIRTLAVPGGAAGATDTSCELAAYITCTPR